MLLECLKRYGELLDRFRSEGLIGGFALVGGLAVSTWSRPRATRDIDLILLLDPAEIPRFVAALESAGISSTVKRGGLDDPVPYLIRAEYLDIMVATHKVEVEAVERSIPVDLSGTNIPVVSPEYLIVIKLKAGGPQDEIDVMDLLAVTELDLALVRELVVRFHVDRMLERLVGLRGAGA